jgi:colanic acid/amylovoran biosynthesis glycosyltransferase
MVEAKKLRVLIVGLSWPPETFIARLLEGLTAAGVDVTVAHSRRPDGEWARNERVHWLATPAWKGLAAKRLLVLVWLWLCAALRSVNDVKIFARYVRRAESRNEKWEVWNRLLPFSGRRWDVIYFPWNSAAIAYLPLFELGSPAVISCRGAQINVAPHNPSRAPIVDGLRESFQQAAAIHCVSAAIKQEARQYGLDEAKATIIYPAVSPINFQPYVPQPSTAQTSFRVVTTGALHWRKGYEYALLAISRLVQSGVAVNYDIIGDGPERQRLRYTIHDLGLEEHVSLHGSLTPDEVRRRLQEADAFLLSSLSEGVSNAVLEAMACGLPVVTTNCGGMREAVTDNEEGFVVPTRDPDASALALAKLAADPALRSRMGQAGRARILQQFDLAQQIKQFVALFAGVAAANEGISK